MKKIMAWIFISFVSIWAARLIGGPGRLERSPKELWQDRRQQAIAALKQSPLTPQDMDRMTPTDLAAHLGTDTTNPVVLQQLKHQIEQEIRQIFLRRKISGLLEFLETKYHPTDMHAQWNEKKQIIMITFLFRGNIYEPNDL